MRSITDFFVSVFEFSFEKMVTPRIISFVYALGMIVAAIFAYAQSQYLARGNWAVGLVVFLGLTLFYVLLIRIFLEVMMVIFRTFEKGQLVVMPAKEETLRAEEGERTEVTVKPQ